MKKWNKNICHLTSVHPPFDIRIYYKECLSLGNAGYNVTLIAPHTKHEIVQNINIVPVKLPKQKGLRIFLAPLKMIVLALKQSCSVYHFHDPELLFCGVLLKIAGKKVVFDIHENVRLSFQSKAGFNSWLAKITRGLYAIFERIAILFFDKLVLAEESYQHFYPKHKSVPILNYPITLADKIEAKQFEFPIKLVYVGVVHPLRGVWEMLYLASKLKANGLDIKLTLVGPIRPNNLEQELTAFIVENNLLETVEIIGKVDYSEVTTYLKGAHIGLSLLKPIPNYLESLPTKLFEYMQHGLPVVTNNFPLYRKYVTETNAGICVDIDQTERCFESVMQLIMSPEKMHEMSENGITITKEQFNWVTQEKLLLNMYTTLRG